MNINGSSRGSLVWRIVHLILVNVQFCVQLRKKQMFHSTVLQQLQTNPGDSITRPI